MGVLALCMLARAVCKGMVARAGCWLPGTGSVCTGAKVGTCSLLGAVGPRTAIVADWLCGDVLVVEALDARSRCANGLAGSVSTPDCISCDGVVMALPGIRWAASCGVKETEGRRPVAAGSLTLGNALPAKGWPKQHTRIVSLVARTIVRAAA